MLEGDIGGGLVIRRQILIPENDHKILRINSGIVARNVGAGSGGFSRLDLTVSLSFFFWVEDLLIQSQLFIS